MLIGIGLCLSRLRLSAGNAKVVCWGLVVSAWGNFGFYLLSALGATGRGLSFGPNRFGGGDVLSILAFLVAYPGAILAPIAMILVARGAFASARERRRVRSPRTSRFILATNFSAMGVCFSRVQRTGNLNTSPRFLSRLRRNMCR